MDKVAELTSLVQRTIEDYARGGWVKARGYAVSDTTRHIYTVIGIPNYPRKFPAGLVVATRIVGDQVIIEHDITDRPLWEELVRAGIPREQIVLAYAGEKLPDEAEKAE